MWNAGRKAASAAALALPETYYRDLAAHYRVRRDRLVSILKPAGFECYSPRGAYYIMTDISAFGFPDDVTFSRHLVSDIGVAAVPGSSFYRTAGAGSAKVRFCFCKKDETLAAAETRFQQKLAKTAAG